METANNINTNNNNSQRMIQEAIRKIALGRSFDRANMSPAGTGGVGTARMIHAGTIDVGEFPDETASSEPIIHKGVLLSGLKDNSGGFLIVPTLFSDVTIVSDAGTKYMYVLNFSHADVLQLNAHNETIVGETEKLDPNDNDSPDYDELSKTGNETSTKYTPDKISTVAKNKDGKQAEINMTPSDIQHRIDKSEVNQSAEKIESKVGNTAVGVTDGKVYLGGEDATEPVVLGQELARLMLEFLTECSKITTPTLMGTMPAVNFPNFTSLTSKIQKFLSKTVYTK